LPSGDDLSKIPNQDVKNPLTKEKVSLGKMLFFEPAIGLLSKNPALRQTYSCASCHVPERGFTAGRIQGIADGGFGFGLSGEGREKFEAYAGSEVDAQGARPLTMHNLAFVTNALWAGTFGSFGANIGTENVWIQADTLVSINQKGFEGLEANNQRALIVHRQLMNPQIADSLGYKSMFDKAFPDIPVSERYSLKTTAFAIAAFQRTILTNQAPFQKWLAGDLEALNDSQKRGGALFFGKAGCARCHEGPALNQMAFFGLGVNNLYQSGYDVFRTGATDNRNLGRGGFTKNHDDDFKFKVPQLYNLTSVGFYFHGASKRDLRAVVNYFNLGVPENLTVPASQISPFFKPLGLDAREISDLVGFLKNGLYDPNMMRYRPDFVLSGMCFPNNDVKSKSDMNCH
jgi:cytochrome c peroxidase